MHDRVLASTADSVDYSSRLIRVDELKIRVLAPGADVGNPKRRVQGGFEHAGSEYRGWVTDPLVEREFLAKADGEGALGECYLTTSLGERADDGCCYKLIAAVITRERAEGCSLT